MAVELLSLAEAGVRLGRDRSGLHRLAKSGRILTDETGHVVVADGELVASLAQLVELAAAAAARTAASERAAEAANDRVELLNLELGEVKARAALQLQAVVEAHEAAARAIRELIPRP